MRTLSLIGWYMPGIMLLVLVFGMIAGIITTVEQAIALITCCVILMPVLIFLFGERINSHPITVEEPELNHFSMHNQVLFGLVRIAFIAIAVILTALGIDGLFNLINGLSGLTNITVFEIVLAAGFFITAHIIGLIEVSIIAQENTMAHLHIAEIQKGRQRAITYDSDRLSLHNPSFTEMAKAIEETIDEDTEHKKAYAEALKEPVNMDVTAQDTIDWIDIMKTPVSRWSMDSYVAQKNNIQT